MAGGGGLVLSFKSQDWYGLSRCFHKLNELISVPILLRAYVTLGLWFGLCLGFSICLVGRGLKRRPIKKVLKN